MIKNKLVCVRKVGGQWREGKSKRESAQPHNAASLSCRRGPFPFPTLSPLPHHPWCSTPTSRCVSREWRALVARERERAPPRVPRTLPPLPRAHPLPPLSSHPQSGVGHRPVGGPHHRHRVPAVLDRKDDGRGVARRAARGRAWARRVADPVPCESRRRLWPAVGAGAVDGGAAGVRAGGPVGAGVWVQGAFALCCL